MSKEVKQALKNINEHFKIISSYTYTPKNPNIAIIENELHHRAGVLNRIREIVEGSVFVNSFEKLKLIK